MLKKLIVFFIFGLILIYIINSKYVYIYFVSTVDNIIFQDWRYYIDALKCKALGSVCDTFNYGKILFYLPYFNEIDYFYNHVAPIFLILIFYTIIFKLLPLNYNSDYLLLFLVCFNPSTILLIERANIDILVFIVLFIVSYSNIYLINYVLINFIFLAKYYPVTFFINFLIENKKRKINKSIFLLSSALLICFLFLLINHNFLIDFFNNSGLSKAGLHYIFSIKTLPKIFKYLFDLNYIFLLVIFLFLFIYLVKKIYEYITNSNLLVNLDLFSLNLKLFIIATNTLLFCFLIFSNYFYREIFLILTIPLIYELKKNNKNIFFKSFYFFILLRYCFLFLYGFILLQKTQYHINEIRIYTNIFLGFTFLKGLFDFVLMSVLTSMIVFFNIKIINLINAK